MSDETAKRLQEENDRLRELLTKAEAGRFNFAARLEHVLNATNDVIWDWDTQSDSQTWNAAGTVVFGWSDIVNVPQDCAWWTGRVHSDDRERVHNSFFAIVDDPTAYRWEDEYRFLKADGSYAFVADRGFVLRDRDGKAFRMIGAMRDVTGEKMREAEQVEGYKAKKLESLGLVAAGMSHDFANVLASILAAIELIEMHASEPQKLLRHTGHARKSVADAAAMTRRIMEYCRTGQSAAEECDLSETVETLVPILGHLLGKGVRIEWTPPVETARVPLSRDRLDRCLMNLCANSRDAMNGVGTVSISARVVEACGSTPEKLEITVFDDGPGVPEEHVPHLFEPLFTTKSSNGTGLGLPNVRRIVTEGGGTISFENRSEGGALFRILIPPAEKRPLVADSEQESPAGMPVTASGGRPVVLIVDDESGLLDLIRIMVEDFGCATLTAKNGDEALKLAATFDAKIDILLTDVVLPGHSGIELAKRIRKNRPDTRIIFMSGWDVNDMGNRCPLPENCAYLGKPFPPEALRDTLSGLLSLAGATGPDATRKP
jgi:PAS domain S-box-containing protein